MDSEPLNGRYLLGRLLGQGGMGAVYEAEDLQTKGRVAVKLISPEIARSASVIERLEREARAAGKIDCEHMARLLDSGTDPRTRGPFLVLELLAGEDLGKLLARLGPLPPKLALRIAAQACAGLTRAHAAGIVHRDIKPANLFMARREGDPQVTVKLLDFGIAKFMPVQSTLSETTGLTASGIMPGTPLYMSPEQARGRKGIDHRSDLWSLGVVLYRALAGRTPNEHVHAFGDLIAAIVGEEAQPVQEFAPWIPPEIAWVVHTALSRDPEERYPSAAAMREALEALLDEGGMAIDEGMLVALDEVERSTKAPRLERMPSFTSEARRSRSDIEEAAKASPDAAAQGGVPGGVTPSPPSRSEAPPRVPSVRAPLVMVAGLCTMIAGYGLYKVLVAPATQGPAHAPPDAGAAVAPQRDQSPRRVQLVILPDDASVEVDGVPALMQDGVVQIVGAPESVHKVRVFKGGAEIEGDVAVTEAGARPPKLHLLSAGASSAAPSSPAPSKDSIQQWD